MEKFRQGKIIVLRPVSYEAMPGEQERAETSAAGPAGVNVIAGARLSGTNQRIPTQAICKHKMESQMVPPQESKDVLLQKTVESQPVRKDGTLFESVGIAVGHYLSSRDFVFATRSARTRQIACVCNMWIT